MEKDFFGSAQTGFFVTERRENCQGVKSTI
jgi:hypothetical protein